MTSGYEADPQDVLAMITPVAAVRDPLERYSRASADSALYAAVVAQLGALRAGALAEMHSTGASYEAIATATGLTRARVQQLVERGREIP